MVSNRKLPSGDQSVLRRLNAGAVLACVRREGPSTLTEISRGTRLSRPTVEAAVGELVGQEWLEELEAAPPPSELGRPARRYRFRAEAGFILGLYIDKDKVWGRLADLDGRIVASRHSSVDPELPPRERLSAARGVAQRCLAGASVPREAVRAVGVGIPGIIDGSGRVLISNPLPGLAGLDLCREVGQWFSSPVLVENDAVLAAVAERWHGAAVDVDQIVYMLIGQRFGASLLLDGRPLRGHRGAAGEIAFHDFMETKKVLKRLRGFVPQQVDAITPKNSVPAADSSYDGTRAALTAARTGDAEAAEIIEAFLQRLARTIAAMVLTVDPELVVIGGALSKVGGAFLPRLEELLGELCVFLPRLALSTMGDESVVLGAVRLALDRVEQELLAL